MQPSRRAQPHIFYLRKSKISPAFPKFFQTQKVNIPSACLQQQRYPPHSHLLHHCCDCRRSCCCHRHCSAACADRCRPVPHPPPFAALLFPTGPRSRVGSIPDTWLPHRGRSRGILSRKVYENRVIKRGRREKGKEQKKGKTM